MAKISDELRRFIDDGELFPSQIDELMCIADRIDKEMVELPRSADGRTWDGSEYDLWTGAGCKEHHNLHGLVLMPGGWYVEDDCGNRYAAESVWHERPDSLGRIAKELEGLSVDSGDNHYVSTHCSEFARRIRRLAEKEAEGGKD